MLRHQILTAAVLLATPFHAASSLATPRVPYDLLPEEMPQEAKERAREAAIRQARVWMDPEIAIEEANLRNGNDAYLELGGEITCDYVDTNLGGSVPKFLCSLVDGEIIKVKYGARRRFDAGKPRGSDGQPPATCPGVRRRPYVSGPTRALPGLSRVAEGRGSRRRQRGLRQASEATPASIA